VNFAGRVRLARIPSGVQRTLLPRCLRARVQAAPADTIAAVMILANTIVTRRQTPLSPVRRAPVR